MEGIAVLWPTVKGEFETLKEVVAGRSIARFGDGEFQDGERCRLLSAEAKPRTECVLARRARLSVARVPHWHTYDEQARPQVPELE